MFGFRISIGAKAEWPIQEDKSSFIRQWEKGDIHLLQWSLRKFEKDKLWIEDEKRFLAVEGVLFNREEIVSRWPEVNVAAWRGSFAAVLIDKQTDEVCVYNDQIGSHMLFWCQAESGFCLSSDLFELAHIAHFSTMDTEFMHRIIEKGYGSGNTTIVAGIQRLGAGQMLRIRKGKTEVEQIETLDLG